MAGEWQNAVAVKPLVKAINALALNLEPDTSNKLGSTAV